MSFEDSGSRFELNDSLIISSWVFVGFLTELTGSDSLVFLKELDLSLDIKSPFSFTI
jgi:hypothetical protein